MTYKVRLTAKANKVYSEADPILKKKIAKWVGGIKYKMNVGWVEA
ncbi:MAG: hypothetical protein O9326_15290 [Microcystis sp. LE19-338.1B]|nr:hypothetical protein [Microcystis sp. LE19-338.1B]MCZ8358736.1 hypothetical protein [Microcystis sp. LE19-388.1G]